MEKNYDLPRDLVDQTYSETTKTETTDGKKESESEPLLIHGRTVSEYQQLYHSVVDPMMQYSKFSTRRPRPYSLQLGRRIKQRLWETLSRPVVTYTPLADGLQDSRKSADAGIQQEVC